MIRLRLGDEFRYCIAKIRIVNFICDGLANEVLTGRKHSRTDQTSRLCRACHTHSLKSDAVYRNCSFLTQHAMECLTIAALGPEEPDAGSTPDDEGQNTFVTEFLADHPPPNHTHLSVWDWISTMISMTMAIL